MPLLLLSVLLDGPRAVAHGVLDAGWTGWASVLYIGALSTTVGYALWGHLLTLYPATTVAPFALLVPLFGAVAAELTLGEAFGPTRLVGMGLILLGLVVNVLGARLRPREQRQAFR